VAVRDALLAPIDTRDLLRVAASC